MEFKSVNQFRRKLQDNWIFLFRWIPQTIIELSRDPHFHHQFFNAKEPKIQANQPLGLGSYE